MIIPGYYILPSGYFKIDHFLAKNICNLQVQGINRQIKLDLAMARRPDGFYVIYLSYRLVGF